MRIDGDTPRAERREKDHHRPKEEGGGLESLWVQ
jgi:hypothetical protein